MAATRPEDVPSAPGRRWKRRGDRGQPRAEGLVARALRLVAPSIITWTAVESNFCTPGSHISMDVTPNGTGGSRVAVTWDRTAANLRGRINLAIVALGRNRLLRWATRPRRILRFDESSGIAQYLVVGVACLATGQF